MLISKGSSVALVQGLVWGPSANFAEQAGCGLQDFDTKQGCKVAAKAFQDVPQKEVSEMPKMLLM